VSEFDDPGIFRNVLESLQTGVYVVDRNQKIRFWNEGAEKITGYLRQDVLGRFCKENSTPPEAGDKTILADAAASIISVLRDGKPTIANISLRHKAGHRVPVRLRSAAVRNGHGSIIGAAESFDESLSSPDQDRRQGKLADYGCLDPETGILTEAVILSHLRECLSLFAEHQVPFSVMCVEVDALDQLRTTYGHAVLPTVLKVVARTFENSLRPTDFLGRLGETRFIAALTECGSDDVERASERVRKIVSAAEIQWWGDTLRVTSSFGAVSAEPGDTFDTLLARAKQSLDESLAAGGNRVTVAL
jgi:diguanylate cyclase (GGDEF)-like protein/PAS domain S-box-containing protein